MNLKTTDGRFIEKRVKIDKTLFKTIIYDIKNSKKLTWKKLSLFLGIAEYTLKHDWMKKHSTIPLHLFKKLIKIHPKVNYSDLENKIQILDPFWGQRIGKKSQIEDDITIPKIENEKFAEFYGVMLGDGCVYSNLSGICITLNKVLDKPYIEYIADLIEDLFSIKPKIYHSKKVRVTRIVVYGKKIVRHFKALGFPTGKKKGNKLEIPKQFFEDRRLHACIRGLQDTDGTVSNHPYSKIMLSISITIDSLSKSVANSLNLLGIEVNKHKQGIYLYGRDKVLDYFNTIGSSNLKHITRFKTFYDKGKVPSIAETESFLRGYKSPITKLPYYGPVV